MSTDEYEEFKTPRSHHHSDDDRSKISKHKLFEGNSDSSTSSDIVIPTKSTYKKGGLTIVAEFDELMDLIRPGTEMGLKVLQHYLEFAMQAKHINGEWMKTQEECQRLRFELDENLHVITDLQSRLNIAQKMLDQEKQRTKRALEDKWDLEGQIENVKSIFAKDNLPHETLEKLSFLRSSRPSCVSPQQADRLNTINEVNTTGSLLSDLSYSHSENDVDSLVLKRKSWIQRRAPEEPQLKKPRRSSAANDGTQMKTVEISHTDKVIATTTLTVHQGGPILATSVIESVPPDNCMKNYASPVLSKVNGRSHNLQQKTVIRPENCSVCNLRMKFGRIMAKCKDCRAGCHLECKDKVPLPCIPCVGTPTQSSASSTGVIGDFTPKIPPYVPALVVHCTNEIEARGLQEVGIYRVSASEKEVKLLKAKFLKGKGTPSLRDVDVHVMCATVKDFLRSLQEPLVTYGKWYDFVRACHVTDSADIAPALYQTISEIPAPNRDTLAFTILHLQRVAQSVESKMNINNLSKIFGPTIIGYSCEDPDPNHLYKETSDQQIVMEQLLKLPSDYWASIITNQQNLLQTPSTDSLFHPVSRGLFSGPHAGFFTSAKKQRKFFATPPNGK